MPQMTGAYASFTCNNRTNSHESRGVASEDRHLSTDDNDAWQKLPQAGQTLVTRGIVPQQRRCALQSVDQLHDALHWYFPSVGSVQEQGWYGIKHWANHCHRKCFASLVTQESDFNRCWSPQSWVSWA